MGIGDRMLVMEQNMNKIWILLNLSQFDEKIEPYEDKLAQIISNYFHTKDINEKMKQAREMETLLDSIKKETKIDIISVIGHFELGREENGGAHYLITEKGGKMVCPDPAQNYY